MKLFSRAFPSIPEPLIGLVTTYGGVPPLASGGRWWMPERALHSRSGETVARIALNGLDDASFNWHISASHPKQLGESCSGERRSMEK